MRALLALFLPLLLGACQAGYYLHLAGGHARLMMAREPVDELLASGELAPGVERQLRLSQDLLGFAERELRLPVGDAYSSYVALDRDWATWNLFAAPRLSLEPYAWCYPVVGCAHYRGHFSKERAEREAGRLREKGFETWAGGSTAYSTLGWFDDPIISPMLQGDDLWFAEVLFHELVHRKLYVPGDTRFNESLATAVARHGVRRWLARAGEPDPVLAGRLSQRARARATVMELVETARQRLQAVYDSSRSDPGKRQLSRALRWQLRAAFADALRDNPALGGYREWFDGPLNNAQLNTMTDYEKLVPAFEQLLEGCAGEAACFWAEAERIAALPDEKRARMLEDLLVKGKDGDA